jgi:aminoglycoside/choline kinase family phosphotransferase
MDEWKDRDLGLCLLQTFRESLGEEAYLEETVKYIAEKKEQAREILSQLVEGDEGGQILAPEVSDDLSPLLFNLEDQQTHHGHH